MEISHDDIDKYLAIIFAGFKLEEHDNTTFMFKQPSNKVKIHSNFMYDKACEQALEEGLLSLEDLEKLIIEKNIFTKEDSEELKSLENKLEAQEILLSKVIRVKGKPERVKSVIVKLQEELEVLRAKKYSMLTLSVENKANDDKMLFLCHASVYNVDDELYWPTYDSILKEKNLTLKNDLLLSFMRFYRGINTEIIRHIARSNLWRIRFVTSQKTAEALFGVPTSEYTNDQLNLAYWSNYYQSIFEMMPDDRPSDLVIEDDDALDSYMKSYYEERNREEKIRSSQNRTKTNLSAFENEEVIVMQSNELYEDMEYDKPREAQRIKERIDVKKRTKHGRR